MNMSAMAQQVCSRVLEAAHESRASVADMQYPIGDAIERFRFGRLGLCMLDKSSYGNIGGGNRLDFTCIGPAVDLAARLEKIASRLHRTVVASEGFAGICRGGWKRPWRVSGGRLFQGRAGLRPGRRNNAGELKACGRRLLLRTFLRAGFLFRAFRLRRILCSRINHDRRWPRMMLVQHGLARPASPHYWYESAGLTRTTGANTRTIGAT